MASQQNSSTLDRQINDYLLTASGHLKENKIGVELRQVAAYGAAAGSALVMMSQAEAAVVMNGGSTPPFSVVNGVGTGTVTTSAGLRLFDMDGDSNNDFAIWGYTNVGNNGITPAVSGNGIVGGTSTSTGTSNNDVLKLSAGATIGTGNNWTGSTSAMQTSQDIAMSEGYGANNWNGNNPEYGFVGVKFQNQSGTHYGWICMKSEPHGNSNASITVQAYAYESSPDTSIQAGDTGSGIYDCASTAPPAPVPAIGPLAYGLGALAMAGLGLPGLRRRRQNTNKSA